MKCPNCGATNSLGAGQCGLCATPLGDKNDKTYYTSNTDATPNGLYSSGFYKTGIRDGSTERD